MLAELVREGGGSATGVDVSRERLATCKQSMVAKYGLENVRLFWGDGSLFDVAPPQAQDAGATAGAAAAAAGGGGGGGGDGAKSNEADGDDDEEDNEGKDNDNNDNDNDNANDEAGKKESSAGDHDAGVEAAAAAAAKVSNALFFLFLIKLLGIHSNFAFSKTSAHRSESKAKRTKHKAQVSRIGMSCKPFYQSPKFWDKVVAKPPGQQLYDKVCASKTKHTHAHTHTHTHTKANLSNTFLFFLQSLVLFLFSDISLYLPQETHAHTNKQTNKQKTHTHTHTQNQNCIFSFCVQVLVDAECTHDGSLKHIVKFNKWGWESFEKRFDTRKFLDNNSRSSNKKSGITPRQIFRSCQNRHAGGTSTISHTHWI